MKRNLELIRKIVLMLEEAPHGFAPKVEIDGYTEEQIGYHCYLIVNAGMADGQELTLTDSDSPQSYLTNLTAAGHDFADAVRSESVWNRVGVRLREIGATVPVDVVKQLAISAATKLALG